MAAERGGDAHLRGMAVAAGARGGGLARDLLANACDWARSRGCGRVKLETTAPLRRAIRFYEREGFRPTGRVRDFFGMPLHEYARPLEG